MSKNKKSLSEKLAIRRSKTILGHSHSPAIAKGAYAVGTSVRHAVGYNRWPAKWLSQRTHWIGNVFDGYAVSHHEEEPENRRRDAVMATRAKYGR